MNVQVCSRLSTLKEDKRDKGIVCLLTFDGVPMKMVLDMTRSVPRYVVVMVVMVGMVWQMSLLPEVMGRSLKDECVSSATSVAKSTSTSAVSKAVADAFAECTSCPCQSAATSAAESISYAVARALAEVTASVKGDSGS